MSKKPPQNAIHRAITKWTASLQPQLQHGAEGVTTEELLSIAPKRFTIYEPMVLLPTGSFTHGRWISTLQNLDQDTCAKLWALILEELSKGAGSTLTHLAVNEGIPLHRDGKEAENVLRSPSGLRMLYGDFGPSLENEPGLQDFDRTLWVSTKQNGIRQTWAPRWTMFSRGNIKEKARLLTLPRSGQDQWAVDLYAGIGYFVFSYAALGFRVLCWELNPWSVEGLRRGAKANRWSVKVVQGDELREPLEDVMAGGEQIVVFLEDNQHALSRIRTLQSSLGLTKNISHVNGGFLPTSEPTWKMAWAMTDQSPETWLHLHENVGVNDMETRRSSIHDSFAGWASAESSVRKANVEHIERVKTFAPDVWHCVFDVHITRSN